MATKSPAETATDSLARIQSFDIDSLPQLERLGQLGFKEVLVPARRLIEIFRRIPVEVLNDLTDPQLDRVRGQADAEFNRLKAILDFDPEASNAGELRRRLIAQVGEAYQRVFDDLWQFIAYGVAKVTDTTALEANARALMQGLSDEQTRILAEISQKKAEADSALASIREVAAEQGVSQQSHFFKLAADAHESDAEIWRKRVISQAWIVGGFAVATLFLHKLPWIGPTNGIEAIQLISSKLLIFFVLAYVLILNARNFLSHKHNAVLNRHRQNALVTYRAIAEAVSDDSAKDIIVAHAASCIFSPQDTGYTKAASGENSGSRSVLELLTRSAPRGDAG